MENVPEMFSVWVTKQVSDFCATNYQLHYIDGTTIDKCLNYGSSLERANHITTFFDSVCSCLFNKSVETMVI